MHIAQIAPLTEAVPPKLYGGTERVIHWLTDELVALGHEVTLFASGNSRTAARLDAPWPRAIRHDESVRDPNALHMMMLERVHRRAAEFDFMHFHLDYYPFSLFSRQPVPFITTLHGRLDLPEHQPVFTTFSRVPVVSISNAQRRPVPHAGWVTTIYHGLPEQLLSPVPGAKPQYLAFLGRIAAEKGVERAISIARQCGMPLRIAAKVDAQDREYYNARVKPLLDGSNIEYVGEISDREKSAFLSSAIALINPIEWPEPFGLVMIEAMACGVPVIAFNRGSVPEIVEDGVTGLIVEDEKGAIGALRPRLAALSRRDSHPIRSAFHRPPHGTGIPRRLPQPRRAQPAASPAGGRPSASLKSRQIQSARAPQARASRTGPVSGINAQIATSPTSATAVRPRNAIGLPK